MTTFFTRNLNRIALFLFLFNSFLGTAQENLTIFLQPAVALNYEIAPIYSHNFSVQNRNFLYDDEALKIAVRQIDITHFSNLKIRDDQSLAIGILYRFREKFDGSANEVRLTQQYNLQYRPDIVRYGHRLRTEQRITSTKSIHRFRYRFSLDFPLRGEKLDVGEPYFVGNLENLLSVATAQLPQYDVRLTLNFGWKLTKKTKFQIGSEFRFENYNQDVAQVLFLLSTLNISL